MPSAHKLFKVSVLGASGGIGQPLSLLLKLNPRIGQLALYDIAKAAMPAKGVAADVNDMNTLAQVFGYAGDEELSAALEGSDVVVLAAGVPRKPGMTRDDLFKINAGIAKNLAEAIKRHAPAGCIIPVITNPVNSVVPIVNEVLKAPHRVAGITTLDVVRASRIVGQKLGKDPREISVPVVGGHAGETIVPLFSQTTPIGCLKNIPQAEIELMDKMVQDAGTVVVEAKSGAGSATLSMAYAASRFVDAVLRGLSGDKGVVECAYAEWANEYYAAPFTLGKSGLEHRHELTNLTEYEVGRIAAARKKLVHDVQVGNDFLNSTSSKL
jgi:malate dehydrogenase